MPRKRGCLPFIQSQCHHRPLSFYPPAWAGRPLFISLVYMNFQPPGCTAPMSPLAWWALTPPSHPYSDVQSGCFLLHLQTLADLFLLGSGVPCAARTFLSLNALSVYEPAADRPAVLFFCGKGTKKKSHTSDYQRKNFS